MGIINSVWPFSKDSHAQFERLLRPHLKRLYNLAYRFTRQRDDAEDLVQDVLLKLYPRLQEMQAIEQLGPWLAKVLYRQYVDLYRRQQRSPISFMNEDDEVVYETHASDLAGPAELMNSELTQGILHEALSQLNDDQRVLVMLHDVEGYGLEEISNMIDTPVGTLKSRLSRARTKLREMIRIMEPDVADGRVSKTTG
jgi:RNA polymerase sigma factor (sigma-70 family)